MTEKRDLSAATDQEDHSERTLREEATAKVQETSVVRESHSEVTDQEDHSARIRKEEAMVKVQETLAVKEDHLTERGEHSTETESRSEESLQVEEDSTLQRRALQRRTSTISATRRKAESTR